MILQHGPSDNYVRMKSVDQARGLHLTTTTITILLFPVGSGYYGSAFSPYGYGYGMAFPGSAGLGFFNPMAVEQLFLWNTCYNPFLQSLYGSSVVFVTKFSILC